MAYKKQVRFNIYEDCFIVDRDFFDTVSRRLVKMATKIWVPEKGAHDQLLRECRSASLEGKVQFKSFQAGRSKPNRTGRKPKENTMTKQTTDQIILKDLCREFDMDPPALRRRLRSKFGTRNKWSWAPDDEELAQIKSMLSGDATWSEDKEKVVKKPTRKAGSPPARKAPRKRTSTAATTKAASSGASRSATSKRSASGSSKSKTSQAKKTARKSPPRSVKKDS